MTPADLEPGKVEGYACLTLEGLTLYQIACLSCGYHRAWPTLLEALADGQRHHAEHTAPGAPPALPAPPQQAPGGDGSDQRS